MNYVERLESKISEACSRLEYLGHKHLADSILLKIGANNLGADELQMIYNEVDWQLDRLS